MADGDALGAAINSGFGVATGIVLNVATLLALVVLLVTALAELRDRSIEAGFLGGPKGRWTRGYRRRRVAALLPVLESLGMDATAQRAIREASSQPKKPSKPIARPDLAFVNRASRWIRVLDYPVYAYHGTRYYLDLMGAIDGRADHEQGIDQIFDAWLDKLHRESVVARPDVLLAPKDGNVLLCKQLAERMRLPLVLCKGDKDKSRVIGPGGVVHETDFEGLRAFCDREVELRPGNDSRAYRAIIVDDSCKNGGQLQSAANRFNQLFESAESGLALAFEPVETAVVLFRSLAGDVSDNGLVSAGLTLHSLVAVGEPQLEALVKRKVSAKHMLRYKDDSSCAQSRSLFGDEVRDASESVKSRDQVPVGSPEDAS